MSVAKISVSFCIVALVLIAASDAGSKRRAPVPPALEIEILDPGVDPVGNPAVVAAPDSSGGLAVDIPPTVLVHRYYYTGDRNFQGPMLPGGPAIVVVNHPKSGERLYVEMQMLPGAPRVIYKSHSIEYDYGKQGITLWFSCCGAPKVIYRNSIPVGRALGGATVGVAKAAHAVTEQTGFSELACKVKDETKNIASTAAHGVKTAGKVVLTPLAQAVQVLPGAKMLAPGSGDRAALARDEAVQRAANASQAADESIRTVR